MGSSSLGWYGPREVSTIPMPYSEKVAELLALAERARTPELRAEFLRLVEGYRALNAHHTDAPQATPNQDLEGTGDSDTELPEAT